jgi:hypothetical protein
MGEGNKRDVVSPYAVMGFGVIIAVLSFGLAVLTQQDAAWVIWYVGMVVAGGFVVIGLIAAGVRLGMRGALRE